MDNKIYTFGVDTDSVSFYRTMTESTTGAQLTVIGYGELGCANATNFAALLECSNNHIH